jgi:CheY-like chemotaxis protein
MQYETTNKPVVLLADDDAIIRFVSQAALESIGCVVHLAKDGMEALNLIETHSFDLLVLDWNMPVLNGWQVALTARKIFGNELPIVIISANSGEASFLNRDSQVANAIYSKPFNRSDFVKLIQRFCGKENQTTSSLCLVA